MPIDRRITSTPHLPERRKDALRHSSHYWELVTATGGIVGRYDRTDYRQAVEDAAMLRNGCATVCDVRRAV
jgi:hypothetical protein